MNGFFRENVSRIDCVWRFIVGSALIMSVLLLYMDPWVALFSIYFIHTGIIRWDPLYAFVAMIEDKLHFNKQVVHRKKLATGEK